MRAYADWGMMMEKKKGQLTMKDLTEIREEIDRVDTSIVALYEERMQLAGEVAQYKISNGKPVLDKEREKQKLDHLASLVSGDFLKLGIRELFEQIMSMSRKKQYRIMAKQGLLEDTGFEQVQTLSKRGARVVYQGVEGAYSHMAAKLFFPKDCEFVQAITWRDAMEAIANQKADYAVLPIENSSAGIVSENYDLLAEYDVTIVGEQILPVRHCLLGLKDAKISDIEQVYSHPQALMQCSKFLEQHRDWERISMKNTAVSAKKIKEDNKPSLAAIASPLTADLYDLQILKEGIQNSETNATRFMIVSSKKIYTKEAKIISICFEIKHESGSLYHAISHFIYNHINMARIESRPIAGRNWEYRFFVDIEGNLKEEAVLNALKSLREEVENLRVLGNYESFYAQGDVTNL